MYQTDSFEIFLWPVARPKWKAMQQQPDSRETPMRFVSYRGEGIDGLAVVNKAGAATGLRAIDPNYPGRLESLIQRGMLGLSGAQARHRGLTIDLYGVEYLPPPSPGKIINSQSQPISPKRRWESAFRENRHCG
jgi:hypothetical protein